MAQNKCVAQKNKSCKTCKKIYGDGRLTNF